MPRCLSDDALHALIREDAPFGDITTQALAIKTVLADVVLASRQPMTVCGVEEAARVFELLGGQVHLLAASGQHVLADVPLLTVHGPVSALMSCAGVAQNLIQRASGVASEVARMVTELRAAGHGATVACPPQSWPGARALTVKAVASGGGIMHRMGLSDGLQLTQDHRVFLDQSVDDMVGRLRKLQPERKLVCVAASLDEAMVFALAGSDIIQLDHMSPESVRATRVALHNSRLHPMLAVSGDVHAGNAVAYADAGAEVLVAASVYLAPPREVACHFSRALPQ